MVASCVASQGIAAGIVTVSCVAVAAVTVVATPSTVTMFVAGVVLNPLPVIVALIPGVRSAGETDVMVNGDAGAPTDAVAEKVTGLPVRPVDVAVRVLVPADGPRVQLPTVAIPLLLLV